MGTFHANAKSTNVETHRNHIGRTVLVLSTFYHDSYFSSLAYFLPEVDPDLVKADVAPKPVCPDIKASEGATSSDSVRGMRYNGVMGSVCKHHFAYKLLNISSRGEKYIFARTILESITKEHWVRALIFKYDIWCNFLPYLINRGFVGIPAVACIPIGHAMTHIMKCQYKYFPWLVSGNGLSPGEEIETFWSKLRYLWARIREMGIGTREDAISDAVEQINRLVFEELPYTLLRQLDRAEAARLFSDEELSELRRKFSQVPLADEDLDSLDLSTFGEVISVDWKVSYVRTLLEYNHLLAQVELCHPNTPEFNALHATLRKTNKILLEIERSKEITRFSRSRAHQYKDAALMEWYRDIKDKLRTYLVLERYYSERQKTYRKQLTLKRGQNSDLKK
jgi:hypothetical protein